MSASKKILLVGDNQEDVLAIRQVLEKNAFSVYSCTDVRDTFGSLAEADIDLVLCFQQVNGQSANFILSQLRERNFLKNACFCVLLSGDITKEELVIGSELGVDRYFYFPTQEETLITGLNYLCQRKFQLNFIKSEDFLQYMAESYRATCLVREEKIEVANEAFLEIFPGIDLSSEHFSSIHHLFDFSTKAHRVEFDKFKFGLYGSLRLSKVKTNTELLVEFYAFRGKNFDQKTYILELMPSLSTKSSSHNTAISLSRREAQIAELSSKGLTIKNIAARLNLSPRTVERHRANIMEKTGSKNIIEALGILNGS
ncbi:response regulator [Algoriphagus namhaensis]